MKNKAHGATLLEVILYVSFTAIVLLASGTFTLEILSSRERQQSISEVSYNANFAIEHMGKCIRNARDVSDPSEGGTSGALSVVTESSSTDPTLFYVLDGVLFEKDATSSARALTTRSVVVRELEFQNVAYAGAPAAIRVKVTIEHVNPAARPEDTFVQTFYTTAVVRKTK